MLQRKAFSISWTSERVPLAVPRDHGPNGNFIRLVRYYIRANFHENPTKRITATLKKAKIRQVFPDGGWYKILICLAYVVKCKNKINEGDSMAKR